MVSCPGAILLILFCTSIAESQVPSTSTEDFQDEYYTVVPTITNEFIPQDAEDAQAILDSQKNEAVIASILPYREKMRRYAINEQARLRSKSKNTPWIRNNYEPQHRDLQSVFIDLCYGLIHDEAFVLASYLHNFLDSRDRTWIVIGMVLTKNMQNMTTTYGNIMPSSFKHERKKLKHPFENMMRVWVRYNRELIEQGDLNHNYVTQDAQALKAEQENGGWHENRDQIELILMKKSIKYARAVIQEFEKANGGKLIENMIIDNIKNHDLNEHLANAYASLARYIKNKFSYIADLLRQYSDGKDCWAAWIMCIAVVHPQEWAKVDQAFQQGHAGDSLSKFIVQKNTENKVMAEMMAVIVDPTFKPTTFTKRPTHDGTGQTGTPPPVSPTSIAPATPSV